MRFFYLSFLCACSSLFSLPSQVDYAFFLFDNGEKNMIASMLDFAKENEKTGPTLDFCVVFMGASMDAMNQKPFSDFPQRLIRYDELGVNQTIDRNWKRDGELDASNLAKLCSLKVRKKVCVGVASAIQGQILQYYQKTGTAALALRDNPSAKGDTDYFQMAEKIQNMAYAIAVPSESCKSAIDSSKQVFVVGHAPLEAYIQEAQHVDKQEVMQRLQLDVERPLVVYGGVYGDTYEKNFKLFLEIVRAAACESDLQVLIVPHPRYLGEVEKRLCKEMQRSSLKWIIAADFEKEPSKKVKTVEALAIADVVVTADATSTIVFQANGLGKNVLHISEQSSAVSEDLYERAVLHRVVNADQLEAFLRRKEVSSQSVFEKIGMPKEGAKRLFNAVINDNK